MSSESPNKDALLRVLSDTESATKNAEKLGHKIAQTARLSLDLLTPLKAFFSTIPEDALSTEQWKDQISGWHSVQQGASGLTTHATQASSFAAVTQTAVTASSGVITFYPETSKVYCDYAELRAARSAVERVLEQYPLAKEAVASLTRLGLDRTNGKNKSALELLNDAVNAMKLMSSSEGVVAILITFRECILTVISDLLQRRPKQESTPKTSDKIKSIGVQCGQPHLAASDFQRIGLVAEKLVNVISGFKQKSMPRSEVLEYGHQCLTLLNAILSSIDESRLKK